MVKKKIFIVSILYSELLERAIIFTKGIRVALSSVILSRTLVDSWDSQPVLENPRVLICTVWPFVKGGGHEVPCQNGWYM